MKHWRSGRYRGLAITKLGFAAMAALAVASVPAAAQVPVNTLYTFTGGSDGANPSGVLHADASGNLYGTAQFAGGDTYCVINNNVLGCGVVFELTPAAGGTWTETVLHTFTGYSDGYNPLPGLVADASGNLYGTAQLGGGGADVGCVNGGPAGGCGVAFELTPAGGGTWTETTLHAFTRQGGDGGAPYLAGLLADASGNLYGTTALGGAGDNGTVFELTPPATAGGGCEPVDRRGRPAGVGRWPAHGRGWRGRRGLFRCSSRTTETVFAICQTARGIAHSLGRTGRGADTAPAARRSPDS